MDEHVHTTQTEQEIALQRPSVGEILRARREELGWSISDVAQWSCIQQTYIEALETGQYHLLPAEVYTLGFLRTYAQLLGLDSSFLVDHYRQENRVCTHQSLLKFPCMLDSQRFTPAIALFLGVIIIIVSYVGWYYFTSVTSSSSGKPIPIGENALLNKIGGDSLSPNIVTMLPYQTPEQTEKKLLSPQGGGQSSPLQSYGQSHQVQSHQPEKGGAPERGKERGGSKKIPAHPVSSSFTEGSLTEGGSVNTSVHKIESDHEDIEKEPLQTPVQPLLKEKSLFQEGTQKATENVPKLQQPLKMSVKPLAQSLPYTQTLHIVKKQKSHLKAATLTTEDLNERQLEKLGVQ